MSTLTILKTTFINMVDISGGEKFYIWNWLSFQSKSLIYGTIYEFTMSNILQNNIFNNFLSKIYLNYNILYLIVQFLKIIKIGQLSAPPPLL